MAFLSRFKPFLERLCRCRIYRDTLPQGVDMFFDLDRTFGIENFHTVFDVGANIGQSAQLYLQNFRAANVYSFEPVAATYRKLEALAQIHRPRLRTFSCAMGATAGEVNIHVHAFDRMSSIPHRRPDDKAELVQQETLSDFCREEGIEKIDFLKIDTEGYELQVLEGAAPLLENQRIRLLLVECEPVAKSEYFVSFAEVSSFLYRFKYELFGIYEQQPSFSEDRNIFFFNPVFICPDLIPQAARL